MTTWHRVFARSETEPDSAALCAAVADVVPGVTYRSHDGERGWERLELTWPNGDSLAIDRFRRDEEGIRAELQAWAAWLETQADNPHHQRLMLHMIATQQVFTVVAELPADPAAGCACQFLAEHADGVYQIDARGIFGPTGTLLLPES